MQLEYRMASKIYSKGFSCLSSTQARRIVAICPGWATTDRLLGGRFGPADRPLDVGIFVAGEGEPGESLFSAGDSDFAAGGFDAGREMIVVSEGDDERFAADDLGDTGVGH